MSCSPWPESISFFKCSWKSNMNYQTNNLPYIIHFLFTGKILEVCWTSDTFRHLAKLAWGSVKWASYVEPTGMNSLPANIWGTKLWRGKQKRCLFSRLFLLPGAIHCSPVGTGSCVGPAAAGSRGKLRNRIWLSPYLMPAHTAPPREDPGVWEAGFTFTFLVAQLWCQAQSHSAGKTSCICTERLVWFYQYFFPGGYKLLGLCVYVFSLQFPVLRHNNWDSF